MMGALKLENTHILLFKLLIFYELLFTVNRLLDECEAYLDGRNTSVTKVLGATWNQCS